VRHNLRSITAGFCTTLMMITAPAFAEDDVPPAGELIFLDNARRPPTPRRYDPALAATLETSADALVLEIDGDMPSSLRRELWQRIGELIGRAWATHVPDPTTDASHAMTRLLDESRHGNRAATTGLRFVVDTLVNHAKGEARASGLETIERSLLWLARINGPLGATALYALSRDAVVEAARDASVTLLGALARERAADRYAEACARLLLE
jgi:hypothetical protein